MTEIYRGFDIEEDEEGEWVVTEHNGEIQCTRPTFEAAMDWVDAEWRRRRAKEGAA